MDAQHEIPDPEGGLRRHGVNEQTEEPVRVVVIVITIMVVVMMMRRRKMAMVMLVMVRMMPVMKCAPLGGDEWHREVEPAQMRRDGGQLELE